MTLRITIASGTAGGWTFSYADAADPNTALLEPRPIAASAAGYPRRPAQPDTSFGADAVGTDVHEALEALRARRLAVTRPLEEYLFEVLLGTAWPAVKHCAGLIELAYADDRQCSLPWELARAPEGYVLDQRKLVRRVTGKTDVSETVLGTPPRVLFVVGCRATDPQIRPGAEYLGILRQASRLRTRLLLEATTSQLTEALKEFQPDVVHFIGHGDLASRDGSQPVVKILDDNGVDSVELDAPRLAKILAHRGRLPPIVVLNTCMSGEPIGVRGIDPLAAQLCRFGVALVIGMSGSVDDRASRVFARSWYRALTAGHDLIESVGRARAHMQASTLAYDWGLATVFARADVTSLRGGLDPAVTRWLDIADNLHRRPRQPSYVGRIGVLRMFDVLVSGKDSQRASLRQELRVLGIRATKQADTGDITDAPELGCTYTCQELAARAASQGHLVVHLRNDLVGPLADEMADNQPAAVQLDRVLRRLWRELDTAARNFELGWRSSLVAKGVPDDDVAATLEAELVARSTPVPPTETAWSALLRKDITALTAKLRAHSFAGDSACVVVVIDDVQLLRPSLRSLRQVLTDVCATDLGLRLVLVFKASSADDVDARQMVAWLKGSIGFGRNLELLRFDQPESDDPQLKNETEAWLAHRQNLLSWYETEDKVLALVFKNAELRKSTLGMLVGMAGSPGQLKEKALVAKMVGILRGLSQFVEQDDELALQELGNLP